LAKAISNIAFIALQLKLEAIHGGNSKPKTIQSKLRQSKAEIILQISAIASLISTKNSIYLREILNK